MGIACGTWGYMYEDDNRSDYSIWICSISVPTRGGLTLLCRDNSKEDRWEIRLLFRVDEFSKAKISAFHGCHHSSGKGIRERRNKAYKGKLKDYVLLHLLILILMLIHFLGVLMMSICVYFVEQ